MAIVDISTLFPPDGDDAIDLLGRCLEVGVAAEEKLFAPGVGGQPHVIAASRDDVLVGVAVTSGKWLRLLVVDPEARGIGVGTQLLDAALAQMRKQAHERVVVAAEPGNYLAPGIDADDAATLAWFEERGFTRAATNTNLLIDVANNDRVTEERLAELVARSKSRGYDIERVDQSAAGELRAFVDRFGPAWTIEVDRALALAPGGVHVARSREESAIVAFAAHDGNNRGLGCFGPAATDEEHRGRGLGEAVLLACLLDVRAAGHDLCTVAWIGPREFYQRAVGVAGERSFVALEKQLEEQLETQ